MIKGSFEIYDIDPNGNKTLISQSTNDLIPSSWQLPINGVSADEDIVLFNDFGSGIDLRIVLSEKRIIRAFERDMAKLNQNVQDITSEINGLNDIRSERQKELDDLLAEIESLKQEIIDSEQLINTSRTRLEQLKSEIPATKRNVQLKRDEITQLLRQKSLLENDVRRFTESIADQTIVRDNIKLDIESIKTRILRRIDGIAGNSDIVSLNKQKTQTINTINNLNQQISDKRSELTVLETEFVRLRDIWIQKDTDNAPDVSVAKSDMDNQQSLMNAKQGEIDALNRDKTQQQGFLENIEQRIIDKGIEIQPDLKTLGDQKIQREADLVAANEQLSELNKQLNVASSGIQASDENKIIKEQELAQLEKIVSDKEQEQIDTQTALMQAQVIIVSNTNSIPVKEASIPQYESAVKEIVDQITEKDKVRIEIQTRLDEITRIRNKRESDIVDVAQSTWTPFEFRTDKESYPNLSDWHLQNLSDSELLELSGDVPLRDTVIIGGLPSIIRHRFEDGQVYYGLFWGSLLELPNASVVLSDDLLPSSIKTGFKMANHVKSTSAGAYRAYTGSKLIEEDGTALYRRIYHLAKMHSVPGSYYYLGVAYGTTMLSIARINRDDDHATSLILNEGHKLEINYIFDFLQKEEKDFEYELEVNGVKHHFNFVVQSKPNIQQANTILEFMNGRLSIRPGFTETPKFDHISINTHSNHIEIIHKKYKNLSETDPSYYSTDDAPRYLNRIIGTSTFADFVIDITPPIELLGMALMLPAPIFMEVTQVPMYQLPGYKNNEYDFHTKPGNPKKIFDLYTSIESG